MAQNAPQAQLYDLAADPSEKTNLYLQEPAIAERLLAQLKEDIFSGRSTEGTDSKNDLDDIILWKSENKSRTTKKGPPHR